MRWYFARPSLLTSLLMAVWLCRPSPAAQDPFVFQDTGRQAGLLPDVAGIRGHGAGWGDSDGDGWIDLYVATFFTGGSKTNMFFRNNAGRFQIDRQPGVQIANRGTGVVFADLDNDGDLDLYIGSMPAAAGSRLAEQAGQPLSGNSLLRNEGRGVFRNISAESGACPPAFGGRSVTVLDFDGDGLLDLLAGEDPIPNYNGSPTASSRLFRNLGDLKFADCSAEVGLADGAAALGVAAADVNNDGWPDFILASQTGNRLFLNDGAGKFREATSARKTFAWPTAGGDNMVCGVTVCDVNRDGLQDIVLAQHFERPWLAPIANRLYLHRGMNGGTPEFEDVTESVGLVPLPMKAPHVEVQDFDNDGWPDIFTTIVALGDRPRPVIFRHLGLRHGTPQFREYALGTIDFPTADDKRTKRSSEFFQRMIAEKKIIYTAPGPSGDYDNDGRLDLFLPSWWIEAPSLLLHNETAGGQWLQIEVVGSAGVNRMGVGSRINVYTQGRLGHSDGLLGCREMSIGYGYASGQPAIAHFGLGAVQSVDVEVILPHEKGTIVRRGVLANQRLRIER